MFLVSPCSLFLFNNRITIMYFSYLYLYISIFHVYLFIYLLSQHSTVKIAKYIFFSIVAGLLQVSGSSFNKFIFLPPSQDALTDLTGDSERLPLEEQHGTWLGHKVLHKHSQAGYVILTDINTNSFFLFVNPLFREWFIQLNT